MVRKLLLAVAALFVVIQLVPVDRAAPADNGVVDAPPAVLATLERACYDCHSNRTVWPWYAHVAPVSWLVAHDVEEGREHVNLTRWNDYSGAARQHLLQEIVEEVEKGEMPLPIYLTMHSGVEVSTAELVQLRLWAGPAGDDEGHGSHEAHEEHEEHEEHE